MKYQLPAGSKIKLLALRVKDLDSMIDFYTQIVGMTSVKRTENISYLGTSEHEVSLTLRKIETPLEETGAANVKRFAFKFPTNKSLKQLLLHVKNLGVKLTNVKYNHNFEWIELLDPEGNQIVLYAEINGETLVDDHSIQWRHDEDGVITINRFLREEETRLKHIPEAAKLTWIELTVRDVAKSLAFYHDLLGMEILPTDRTDTKTLVLPNDHSQQVVLTEQSGLVTHNYEGLGVDYISFKMIRSKDVDDLYHQFADNDEIHYDEIDHLLFINDPDQINLTFSVW
ncbi:VOC family protein [Nicoliella spurrieriana]|uniref:VOC family protein n=1 Tax=Nicoliella spurrieriana TaxID=2925830 RepID=A0A976X5N2_9LACO|nr:VOC family protein [Nicoliella spurrieriana]UQS86849.1 VOC family protein [Nicoliella spurrieriana]